MGTGAAIHHFLEKSRIAHLLDAVFAAGLNPKDAVLISGFYRSGTTFLMESLAEAKRRRTVFEPFCHQVPQALGLYAREVRIRSPEIFPIVQPLAQSSKYDAFFINTLRGRVQCEWTRNTRTPMGWLRRQLLIKSVRANGALCYLKQRFGCQTINIRRHPLGIAASVSRLPRMRRVLLDEDNLRDILAREVLDNACLRALETCRNDPWKRLGFLIALSVYVPLLQADQAPQAAPIVVRYEDLALDYYQTMEHLLFLLPGSSNSTPPPRNSWTTWTTTTKDYLEITQRIKRFRDKST